MNVQEWISAKVDVPMDRRQELAELLMFSKEYYEGGQFYKDVFEEAQHYEQAEQIAGISAALTYKVAVVAEIMMKIAILGLPDELAKIIKRVKEG